MQTNMKTNTSLIKIHTLRLSDMSAPAEISAYCEANSIKKMVYTFSWKGRVLKFGKSGLSKAKRQYLGNRPYRQAAWIPGWTQYVNHQLSPLPLPYSSAGEDMRHICEKTTSETKLPIHKNDVVLTIEDMTDYPVSISGQPNLDVDIYEGEKIQEYIAAHGVRPIGNIRTEKLCAEREIVSDDRLMSVLSNLEKTI